MEWILGVSILVNILFLIKGYFSIKTMRSAKKHIVRVREGQSQSPLAITGYDKPKDDFFNEVNHLVEQLNETNTRFEKMIEENKRMVSSISHDFRTPLTSMLGYIQMLKKEAFTSNEEKYLTIIEERTRTLSLLVEDFYTLSLLESNEYAISFQRTNPILLVQEQIALYYGELETTFDVIDIHLEEEPLFIQTSVNDLKRIIGNVIKNAFQHGKGTFTVSLEKTKDGLIFHFINQVSKPQSIETDQLFERLYRADESRKSGSTGLGLSIAQKLAERLRMQIKADLQEESIQFQLFIPMEDWKLRNSKIIK